MNNFLVCCFHVIGMVHFVYGLLYNYTNVEFPEPYRTLLIKSNAPLKGTTVFLTTINSVSIRANFIELVLAECKQKTCTGGGGSMTVNHMDMEQINNRNKHTCICILKIACSKLMG